MKRPIIIVSIIIFLIAGAAGAGWLYYRANPAAWDSFVAEMEGESSSRPEPARIVDRPAVRSGGALQASGNIEAEEITVAAQLGGQIVSIFVDDGDTVTAGDLLLQLNRESLLAQRESTVAAVAQAVAARAAAQAQLDLALAGATDEEIAAAEAAVLTAEGALSAAEAAQDQTEISAGSARTTQTSDNSVAIAEAAVAQADGAVALAEANLALANAELARLQAGARSEEIAMHQALVNQAQSNFLYYENIHFSQFIDNDIGGFPEEQARYLREAARGARDAAQAQLDLANAGAGQAEVAIALAGVAAARAQLEIAEAGAAMATAELEQVRGNSTATTDHVALADAVVAAAAAQVAVAAGQLAQAEANLARLHAGATTAEIAMLQAQVDQAEAAVAAADAVLSMLDIELARTELVAPTGGIVMQCLVHVGELAAPGAPLFTLADLDVVKLTVYVPEASLGRVSLGQEVTVAVDAYDDLFSGEVSHIATQAEFTPQNVQTQEERVHMVFAVEVRLENPEHLLKPGMPADAVFQ